VLRCVIFMRSVTLLVEQAPGDGGNGHVGLAISTSFQALCWPWQGNTNDLSLSQRGSCLCMAIRGCDAFSIFCLFVRR
jgi:hypothetical protein